MIHYQLRCVQGHGFEGWFRDSHAFEDQANRHLLSCPQCGTMEVERALMSPAVSTRRKSAPREPVPREYVTKETRPQEPVQRTASADVVLPDQLRAALQRLRSEIERHCDDVGDGFAEAARRLHRQGGTPAEPQRGIYGSVTESERDALAEEGIETARIPWLPRAES